MPHIAAPPLLYSWKKDDYPGGIRRSLDFRGLCRLVFPRGKKPPTSSLTAVSQALCFPWCQNYTLFELVQDLKLLLMKWEVLLCEASPPSIMTGLGDNCLRDLFNMVGREASQSSVSLCEVSPPSMLASLGGTGVGDLSIWSAGRPPKAVYYSARCPHRAYRQV